MRESWPALFRGRHFRSEVIVLCVRWYLCSGLANAPSGHYRYLRYPPSYRGLDKMMAEHFLSIDHSTIAPWVLHYAPTLNQRIRREMRHPDRSWRVDETYVRVAGKRNFLYRCP
jgi:transposase, IS6 family